MIDFKNVERISFRLKNLLNVIQNKETLITIFHNGEEIDYDQIGNYKDFYIANLGIGHDQNGELCIAVEIIETIEMVYVGCIKMDQ